MVSRKRNFTQCMYLLHENVKTSTYDEHITYIELTLPVDQYTQGNKAIKSNHRTPLILHCETVFVCRHFWLATSTFETRSVSFKLHFMDMYWFKIFIPFLLVAEWQTLQLWKWYYKMKLMSVGLKLKKKFLWHLKKKADESN